jgi:hypothetical protein
MADAQLKQVKQFMSEAIQVSQKDREKHVRPGDPVHDGPSWPYVSDDKIAARVSRELSTPEESRKQLITRLETFRYPYEAWRPGGTVSQGIGTFYSHVESLGLLDFLLTPPFLWDVRRVWFFRRHHDLELEQRVEKKSQYGYPVAFHREMMLAIAGHLARISKIAKKHQVPVDEFKDYYGEALRQLLKETAVSYPQWKLGTKPVGRIRPRSFGVDSQLAIFDEITKELAGRGTKNNKLAYELTALICSPESCIRTRILEPNPETVRTNVRDRRKKST